MRKEEKKLLKLQRKAQECVSRKKAQKILHKAKKWQKCLKSYPIENHSQYPHRGCAGTSLKRDSHQAVLSYATVSAPLALRARSAW